MTATPVDGDIGRYRIENIPASTSSEATQNHLRLCPRQKHICRQGLGTNRQPRFYEFPLIYCYPDSAQLSLHLVDRRLELSLSFRLMSMFETNLARVHAHETLISFISLLLMVFQISLVKIMQLQSMMTKTLFLMLVVTTVRLHDDR